MSGLRKSTLKHLTASDSFLWLTGIEDTFITAPWPQTGRTLDEYELTQHYERWREDLDLMAQLGVKTVRYGIPWHCVNPARNRWNWSFPDRTLNHLLELGIDPIVDLVHYGVPQWIEGAFVNPDFPSYMAEYAARLAERFKGRIHAYTPLNEPRITAWYCGKLGWWPPFRRSWRGFISVLNGVCRGIVKTIEALESVDPEILPVHVDATDLYQTEDPALQPEVERRQEIVFLALDFLRGDVTEEHTLFPWLLKHGILESDLNFFREHAKELSLIGINLYPLFSRKILSKTKYGLRTRMPYSPTDIVARLGELYFRRYRVPIFVSETASLGSIKRRKQWLDQSVLEISALRERGIPLVGYTWWPMYALVTWGWRQGKNPPSYYLKQMGLWDLDANLNRISTPLVQDYQRLVASGSASVGALKKTKTKV